MRIILLLFIAFSVYGQDTIYKVDKEVISASILEINEASIKFKKFANPDGPLYTEDRALIHYIKFKNGTVDTISKVVPAITDPAPPVASYNSSVIIYKGGNAFSYKTRGYSDDDINTMISAYPNGETKSLMQKKSTAMLEYKQRQHLSIGLGYGIGFAVPIVVTFGTLTTNNINYDNAVNTIVAGALIGAVIRIAGNVGFFINKNKKLNEKREILDLMNEGK